ncbi:alpha-amylase [Nakamurella antarctica]|uniref:Alpha-amylase n=1 Tax=Nakamurella antarctica TaxID=1902245 RepID=A0A3G8ZM31_9ACTN|nr:alpha-amylase family protein [Nakamurella antarctica]AZI58218.1 alpha-amylase [Nakamurella antarctica]
MSSTLGATSPLAGADTARASAAQKARTAGRAELRNCSESDREVFDVRVAKWWPDLDRSLQRLYPAEVAADLGLRLVRAAARAFADRHPDLRHLDLVRTLSPDWFEDPSMLGYAAYAERFAQDLAGVEGKLEYLQELGVTYLHLMPLLTPREGDSDGGYAVADYRRVRADLGTNEDLEHLTAALRSSGMSLVLDLVLNHVAREHEWAVAARRGEVKYRNYFYILDTREEVDAFEETLPEVFPDFAPGNFTWDEDLKGWVWTTFNSFQWDVNWSNPDVLFEYAEIILYLANLGVEVLRMDAIAFMWKRLGTNSQNQVEVHDITQALRAVARIACPAIAFKAEAIVAPADLVQYLGTGEHYGKVSDLAYHNVLMVQIWSMLAAGEVSLAAASLRALPPIPSTTAWITYVRCHDDIGWAIDDADAESVGLSGWAHRTFLSDYYSGHYWNSPASGVVFQSNPETGDRRISGTAASLAGLESALRRGDDEAADTAIARLILGYALVMGWGGIPVIWMGDELAMMNDPQWAAEPGHEADNRWAHRPRMDWRLAEARHRAGSPQQQMFSALTRLQQVRRAHPHFHASIAPEIAEIHDEGILAVLRVHPIGPLVGLHNFSNSWRPYPGSALSRLGVLAGTDLTSGATLELSEDDNLWLPPYGFRWVIGSSQ